MARARRADICRAAGALRRDGGWHADGIPVPGQQFGDALGGVSSEAREHIAQPGLGIDAIELGGLGQRVDGGGGLAAHVAAGEQPILAAESDGTDRPLSGIVVDFDAAVVAIAGELLPAADGIADSAGELALAGDPRMSCFEPSPELTEERSRAALADVTAQLGQQAPGFLLDVVKTADALQRLIGQRRAAVLVDVEELAPDMRPAGDLADDAGSVQSVEAGIAVGLQ